MKQPFEVGKPSLKHHTSNNSLSLPLGGSGRMEFSDLIFLHFRWGMILKSPDKSGTDPESILINS